MWSKTSKNMAALARVGLLRQTGSMHLKAYLIFCVSARVRRVQISEPDFVLLNSWISVWFPLVFSRKCHNNTSIITLSLLFSLFQFHLHLTWSCRHNTYETTNYIWSCPNPRTRNTPSQETALNQANLTSFIMTNDAISPGGFMISMEGRERRECWR
jgi:hypothetical protein